MTSRPWLVLAHVVRVDLIVSGAEHRAGLVTCRGPAIVGSWSVTVHQMRSLGQAPLWTQPNCPLKAKMTP